MNFTSAITCKVVAAFLLFASSKALAVSLTDFSVLTLSGDRTQLEFTFDGPAPTPIGYSIEQPARISLDFRSTTSLLDTKYFPIGNGNARNAAVVSADNRTRIVISLTSLVPYASKVSGNKVIVLVGENASSLVQDSPEISDQQEASGSNSVVSSSSMVEPDTAPKSDVENAIAMADDQQGLVNVDFRRSKTGSGQVMLEFSDDSSLVNVSDQGGKIVIELEGHEIPNELRRRLDVVDFATSVHYINVYKQENDAIVELELDGAYEYLAYQTDNHLTVDVKTVSQEQVEARLKEKFPYSGERLSLSFQDIEVRNVLQLIADYVGLNLVASDTIDGNITLRLQNVPWDQALDLVLKTKGLDKRQNGNVLLVAPAEEIAERERLELESQQQVEQLAPLVTEFIQINYAKAEDILAVLQQGPGGSKKGTESSSSAGEGGSGSMLETISFSLRNVGADQAQQTSNGSGNSGSGFLSPRGSASVDSRTNTLIIRDTASSIEEIRRAIQIFDVPVKQVLIEARVVSATATVGRELGIRWGGNINSGSSYPPIVASGSLESTQSIGSALNQSAGTEYEMSYPNALAVNLPTSNPNAGSFAIGVAAFNYALDLELSALESSGKAEVISQPKVLTSDGKQATIGSGKEIPIIKTQRNAEGIEEETVEYKQVLLSLEATPQITPDNKVILDLAVVQDQLSAEGPAGAVDTNRLSTQVLVESGQTLVLGGVFQKATITNVTKTPILGDLPLLGRLFKRNTYSEDKTELLIFITPKIVSGDLVAN